jgi:toxin FitB
MEPGAVSPLRWLIDSNAVMGYLNQDPAPGFAAKIESCFAGGAAISVITLIEVLGWRGHTEQSRADARRLLAGLTLIGLTPAVVERTIALRSQLSIALPDAVIAASALVEGLHLVTRNVQDFDRVEGLVVDNPYENG